MSDAVRVRRVMPEGRQGATSEQSAAAPVETALVRLGPGSPMVAAAVKALVRAARFLQRSKEWIQYLESTGGKNASRAVRRHAVAVRDWVSENAQGARERWDERRAIRKDKLEREHEARSVRHCREWGSW